MFRGCENEQKSLKADTDNRSGKAFVFLPETYKEYIKCYFQSCPVQSVQEFNEGSNLGPHDTEMNTGWKYTPFCKETTSHRMAREKLSLLSWRHSLGLQFKLELNEASISVRDSGQPLDEL